MAESDYAQIVREMAEMRAAIAELQRSFDVCRGGRCLDSEAIWRAIGETNKSVGKLAEAVSTGRGAVHALAWVGGIIIGFCSLAAAIAAWVNALRH